MWAGGDEMSATDRCAQVMEMIDQTLADYERETSTAPAPRRRLPPFGDPQYLPEPAEPR